MSLLTLVIIIIAVLLLLEFFKHYITKTAFKYFLALIILFVILMVLSAYINIGSIFGKGGPVAQTGAVIAGGVKGSVENIDLEKEGVLEKSGESIKKFLRKILEE